MIPLEQVGQNLVAMLQRTTVGKIVLTPDYTDHSLPPLPHPPTAPPTPPRTNPPPPLGRRWNGALEEVVVADNPEASRFEAKLEDPLLAVAQYERSGNRITFTHTIVAQVAEGHGVGAKLVKFALDQARSEGPSWLALPVRPELLATPSGVPGHRALMVLR